MAKLPRIAAMIGDPAGIGPEVCVKTLDSGELDGVCDPLLIGNVEAVQHAARVCGIKRDVVRTPPTSAMMQEA